MPCAPDVLPEFVKLSAIFLDETDKRIELQKNSLKKKSDRAVQETHNEMDNVAKLIFQRIQRIS